MKKTLILLSFCLSQLILAQKEANIWYFGLQAGIDFNSGNAVILKDGEIGSYAGGSATISSPTGDLLFYTGGQFIYNKNHNIMPNGNNIGGTLGSTQAAIIVPKPEDSNIYYVFTTGAQADHRGLKYSVVDMRLDGGLGDVTAKDLFLSNLVTEKLTAIKSTSFNGYWIVAHRWNSNKFLVYKVASTGVDTNVKEYAIGPTIGGDITNARGQLKLSPNGRKLAMATEGIVNELQFFDFNPSTGEISNPLTLINEDTNTKVYGVEFSPNGKLLYVSGENNGVYQYNLEAGNLSDIKASKLKLNVFTNRIFSSLQLASDGRIYVAKQFRKNIDYISNPDVLGIGCDYKYELGGLDLGDRVCGEGFPQFIQSFFFVGFSVENLCFGNTAEFTANFSESYDSILWNFGDGTTSSQENPRHIFTSSGTYSVTLTVISGTDTSVETKEIIIYEKPLVTKPIDLLVCDDNNDGFYNFDFSSQTTTILNGQNTVDLQVNYFANQSDFDNNRSISNYTNYQNTSAYLEETIIARVQNTRNTDCFEKTEFKIEVFKSPTPKISTDISSLSSCDNTSYGTDTDGKVIFNLKSKDNEVLNGQSIVDFSVTYYLDENLTQIINSPTTYVNSRLTQRIYVKVENKDNNACYGKTSFLLEVYELPKINSLVTLKQCDNSDINGFSFFNLTEANTKIIANSKNYRITFFENKTSAENDINPIVNETSYQNQLVSADKVWARVESADGCFRVSEINLIISTTQIPIGFMKTFYECDSGINLQDGITTFDFSSVTREIENLFPSNQKLIIKYYRNESDALSELNEINNIGSYQNVGYPNQQDIYIRVDSELDNDCLGLGHYITLNIDNVPIANLVNISPQCDNDRDGFYAFDTSSIENTLVGGQTNVIVSYFDESGGNLPSPLPNPFLTTSQNITARITNVSSKDPKGKCYSETEIEFLVKSVPIANSINSFEQCDDDSDGIVSFNTSNIESTILGGQIGMIVKYFDKNNNVLPSPLPNPFSTKTQRIKVRVENPEFTTCFQETYIDFIVREKPAFELPEITTICISNNSPLEIEANNPKGNYIYEWRDENDIVISNSSIVKVTEGGLYSVVAISSSGCRSDIKEILIDESSISSITINSLEIVGDSDNNSIKIKIQNIGLGDYEFSLLDNNLNIIYDYQKEPFFDYLEGGVYKVLIKDINGCGIQSLEVPIINYPKFFTPNDDGVNDIWHIKGFDQKFYKSGVIQIFNRYGKQVKILSLDKNGWDGIYKGKKMISNDYWFRAELIDLNGNMIVKKGNFSLLRK